MRKITRYFLLTGNIHKISLYMYGMKIYLYSSPISHLGQSNEIKSALHKKK